MNVQAIQWAAAGTGFTCLMTAMGAALVFLVPGKPRPNLQKCMLGFAAGVMTAASVWSLLIPAIEQAETDGGLPGWAPAGLGLLIGAAFLAVLDGWLAKLQTQRNNDEQWRQNALLMTAITLHNIPEGMAVGLAFALAARGESFAAAAALALGIGIQNVPEGAAVSLPLLQEGCGKSRAFLGGTLSGVVEPLFGILVVLAVAWAQPLMPWLLSFAAGAMLYVVAEDLIPQGRGTCGTWGFLAGFLIMMTLDVALG